METCLLYTDVALKKLSLLYEVFQNVTDLFAPSVASELQVTGFQRTTLRDGAFLADIQNFVDSVKKVIHIAETQMSSEVCDDQSEQSILVTEIYESLQVVENAKPACPKTLCSQIDAMLKKMYTFVLLWDRHDIRQIERKADVLNGKLGDLCECTDIVACLKVVCVLLEEFVRCLYRRQDDLGQPREIVTLRAELLKRCLENVAQTKRLQLEYNDVSCFKKSEHFWTQRFFSLTSKLKIETEDSGKFMHSLQQLSWAFSEEERALLVEDTIEQLARDVVVQSMAVAYASSSLLQGRISESCQRLLRLVSDDPTGVSDELATLEKLVNMSVLRQVVQAFLHSAKPLDDLLKEAAADESTAEFHRQADLIYQVSRFVACCCTSDPTLLFLHLSVMESIDVELVPAVVAYCGNSDNAACIHHVTLLYQEWGKQLDDLIKCVLAMTDAREMMKLLKSNIQQEIDNVLETLCEFDLASLRTLAGYGKLMAQLPTTWIQDSIRDSIVLGFRAVQSVGRNFSKDPLDSALKDRFKKRLKVLWNFVLKYFDTKTAKTTTSHLLQASKSGLSIRAFKLNDSIGSLLLDVKRLKVRISALEREVETEFVGNAPMLDVLTVMCRSFGELAHDLSNARKIKELLSATQELIALVKTVAPEEIGRTLLEQLEALFSQLCVLVTATKAGDDNQHKACCKTLFSMVSLVVNILAVSVSAGILERRDAGNSDDWLKKFQCWNLNITCAQNGTIV